MPVNTTNFSFECTLQSESNPTQRQDKYRGNVGGQLLQMQGINNNRFIIAHLVQETEQETTFQFTSYGSTNCQVTLHKNNQTITLNDGHEEFSGTYQVIDPNKITQQTSQPSTSVASRNVNQFDDDFV